MVSRTFIAFAAVTLALGCAGTAILAADPDLFIGFDLEAEGDEGIERIEGTGHCCQYDPVALTAIMKNGYIFSGWYDADGNLRSSDRSYAFEAMNEKLYAKSERGAYVSITHSEGILATVGNTYRLGSEVPLEAYICKKGLSFEGWYEDGIRLVSSEAGYTFTAVSDISLVAKSSSSYYSGDSRLEWDFGDPELQDSITVLYDGYTGYYIDSYENAAKGSADLIPGKYKITLRGTDLSGNPHSETIVSEIEGDFSRTLYWENVFRPVDLNATGIKLETSFESVEWSVSYEELQSFRNSAASRSPAAASERVAYAEHSSASINSLATALLNNTIGMTDLDRADYVLKFVQRWTDYQYDSDYSGMAEYWKYPVETALDRSGDCEDTVCLYCALMECMGYDAALLIYDGPEYDVGHAESGIAVGSVPGGYYYWGDDGQKYYTCETTSNYMFVGESSDRYERASVLAIP